MVSENQHSPAPASLRKSPWVNRLRYRLIPANSQQEYDLWTAVKSLRARRYGAFLSSLVRLLSFFILLPVKKVLVPRGVFAAELTIQDNSRVVLYTEQTGLFPNYQPRRPLPRLARQRSPVTLITTLINEKDSVIPWLESLSSQTRPPDEVVVVDGGSTDGTLELLQDFAGRAPFPFRLFSEPGANISRGRNLAISQASSEIIACTDLGCQLHPDWLENITAPFEADPDTQVVAGWYETHKSSAAAMQLLGLKLADVNPSAFLPSSRSIAFSKAAWRLVRGYPEWITLTGEDSFFDLELKRACRHWAFVPEAVVRWQAPASLRDYWKKVRGWSVGDGETSFGARLYWHTLLRLSFLALFNAGALALSLLAATFGWLPVWGAILLFVAAAYLSAWFAFQARLVKPMDLLSETGAEIARLQGFLKGTRLRAETLSRRYQHVAGFFFILAGVPIDDTGGGARCTQIALELLRQGYAVVYINRFPRYESLDLDLIIYHPDLLTAPLQQFKWEAYARSHRHLFAGKPLGALVEFPLKEFLPILEGIRRQAGVVIYDLLDDWNTSLGGDWYSQPVELDVIHSSQVLVATESSLAERLERLSQRPVALLPNAVNAQLFDPDHPYTRPADLPVAEWSALYIGALWGQWFDWDLLKATARAYPQAAVVVIGDYRGQCQDPPPNLHFLGLKPQRVLPAYLAHVDVTIIPWIVSPITQATSPLKIYEYLTMRKPVVAPDLRPLRGLPGVFLAQDAADFIAKVGQVRHARLDQSELASFAARNNWRARLGDLLQLVEQARRVN